jgi:hypothetical protein
MANRFCCGVALFLRVGSFHHECAGLAAQYELNAITVTIMTLSRLRCVFGQGGVYAGK